MMNDGTKLWLWRDGDRFVAYDNPYPTFGGGDPMTLGEPVATAIYRHSTPADNRPATGILPLNQPNSRRP